MMDYPAPLLWLAREYLNHNPFFIYGGRTPLLHQTEVVAKVLFLRPNRILLADVVGLGKTITALRILRAIGNYDDEMLVRVLVIVPSVLINQWIDEMKKMGIKAHLIEKRKLRLLKKYGELPSGWYIGSVDTLKREEYLQILRRNRWTAFVVDEAHKLGILGQGPNLRWKNLGDGLIIRNKEAILLLLSATPHRGKANDYLSRLALLDPTLLRSANVRSLDKTFDKPDYYLRTHNVIVFRRSKEDINKVYECREVFKPCKMLAVLIEPSEEEKKLLEIITELAVSYLGKYYGYLMENLGWDIGRIQGIIALLRTIIIKRGLSSPQALYRTFSKLVVKRGKFREFLEEGLSPEEIEIRMYEELEKFSSEMDEILTGDIEELEDELDERFNEIASYLDRFLDEKALEDLKIANQIVKMILDGRIKDSKVETLKRILENVLEDSPVSSDLEDLKSGKVIIFTEFRDTAEYLLKRLQDWAKRRFGDGRIVRIFTSRNKDEIEDVKRWLSEEGKRVLITTDVAGEGLNLQQANILINYEIAWSPIRLEQRIGRIWRYGQNKTTYIFNLFLAHALEKEVAEVVFSKLYGINMSFRKAGASDRREGLPVYVE